MATRSDTIQLVRSILQITGTDELLNDTEIGERVDQAVKAYSKLRPLTKHAETVGNGEQVYALPSDWYVGFSSVVSVELPVGSYPRTFLDENKYEVVENVDDTQRMINTATSGGSSVTLSTASDAGYFKSNQLVEIGDDNATETNWTSADGNTSTGVVALKNTLANTYSASPYIKRLNYIVFTETSPTTSDVFSIQYTTIHVLSDTRDTIPYSDYDAVVHLAAAYAAYSIADEFGKHQDSTISADAVDYATKSTEWRSIGDKHREIFDDYMGLTKTTAGAELQDLDPRFTWGRTFLFHGGRYR